LATNDLQICVCPKTLTADPLSSILRPEMSDDTDTISTPKSSQDGRRLVKSKVENLFLLLPSGMYYGRVKIKGKTLKKSLETASFEVAKRKLKAWLAEVRGKPTSDSTLGSLAEEYAQRLQLKVDTRDIKPRTRETKLESVDQCGKVWHELFSTGKIDPANYGRGGDQSKKVKVGCPLFNIQSVSKITPSLLDQWRAGMVKAYSPSRVNGAMTVFGELLDLAVELGFVFDANKLRERLKYVRVQTSKLTHLPTVAKYLELITEIHARSAKGDSVFQRGLDDGGYKFEFLCTSGARNDSANHLEWSDIDWTRNRVDFHKTKRDKYSIPLFPELRDVLERVQKLRGGNPTGRIFRVKSIKKVLSSACAAVGTPRLTPHDCRHYFATRCLENPEVDIPTVSRWLGHKDGGALAMKTYGHLRDEHSQKMAAKMKFG
jgi:integrase